ncbi:DUF4190 domain-containing protein [Herbiconiux liangxiaofengii]|uniref:DUF4190 domain-containing protein n=1 Tax=Herbiconiux liangxiaofengii TaxID=3342795 RepID=UPI0035BA33E6
MSDTNNLNLDKGSGEPSVPPVTPPAAGQPQSPVGGYQSAPPPPAPGYTQNQPPAGYPSQPPAPGYGQQPQQGYQQPQQQPYYGGYQGPVAPPMNTLAIITIILAFVFSVAGIVTGHISLKQIDRTGESGRGLAKAGLILSYVFTGLWVLGIIAYVVFIVLAIAFAGTAAYGSYSTY